VTGIAAAKPMMAAKLANDLAKFMANGRLRLLDRIDVVKRCWLV
jgi:hypothetical protein